MKKLVFGLLATILFATLSCSSEKEADNLDEKFVKLQNFRIESFMNDKDVIKFVESGVKFSKTKKYSEEYYNEFKNVKYYYTIVFNKYQYNVVLANFASNSNDTKKQYKRNCCNRNADGTTNWDCCNFFEAAHVCVLSYFNCDSTGDPNAFYDCVQSLICNNC